MIQQAPASNLMSTRRTPTPLAHVLDGQWSDGGGGVTGVIACVPVNETAQLFLIH